jgi:hypothetical protein
MTTYTDHRYKSLQYQANLNLSVQLTIDYDSFEKALQWLLQCGKGITHKFQDAYNQPCAFTILERNFDHANENFEDYVESETLDLYWLEPRLSIVFSEQAYRMTMREHLIFLSHQWDAPIPKWNIWIKNKKEPMPDIMDEFENIKEDKIFCDSGTRSGDEFKSLGQKNCEDSKIDLELVCGCDDSYFEFSLKKMEKQYHDKYRKEFEKWKESTSVLLETFDSYVNGGLITDFAKQLNLIINN